MMIFSIASVVISLSSRYSLIKNTIPFSSTYFTDTVESKSQVLYTLKLIYFYNLQNFQVWGKFSQLIPKVELSTS